MRSLTVLSAVLIGGLSTGAHAACEQPRIVIIPPEGEIEGEEQAEQIAEDTQEYMQAMQEYVNCIMAELESAGEDAPTLYRNVLVQRNNLAVAEAEAVMRWFDSRFPDAASVELPE